MATESVTTDEYPNWWDTLERFDSSSSPEEANDLMSTWKGKSNGIGVPEFGWRIALSHRFKDRRSPWNLPRISHIPALVGLAIRYLKFHHRLKRNNQRPCMDFFNQQPLRQIYGVPLGGIGGGSINRGWQGDFCRWQLRPGIYDFETTTANQFIVSIRNNNNVVYQQVLSVHHAPPKGLTAWKWGFPGSQAFYHGLYPCAWTVYELSEQKVTLTCKQLSPVIPHDYQDSSLPAAVFSWSIENNSDSDLEITIVMTMENGIGSKNARLSSGHYNEAFSVGEKVEKCSGVIMHNFTYDYMPYTMTVAASESTSVEVTRRVAFDPTSSGDDIWNNLMDNGRLTTGKVRSPLTTRNEAVACAVASTFSIVKKSIRTGIDFALTWDMPKVHFGAHEQVYCRRYTRYFGSSGKVGPEMALYALQKHGEWDKKIKAWQNPVLKNKHLPRWYKSAIFNELYYITDGGTIWVELNSKSDKAATDDSIHSHANSVASNNFEDHLRTCETIRSYGKFAYLEGQEYRMYNTYDVHFYASIALASLWPKLEISLQYDIAASILSKDERVFHFLMDGDRNPIKSPGVVPHDVGDPDDEPWNRVNAYFVHDTASWKDLNPKFVLQVFRDFHITGDRKFLEDMYPVCLTVMAMTMKHDKDGDGLIENSGTADQTFDGWSVTGPSAYCGGLWLASLRCMVEAARTLELREDEKKYEDILKRATDAYQSELWNGEYFNYDSNRRSNHCDSVMADQCAGQWYLLAADIADVLPKEQVHSCLSKVFDLNVQAFANGTRGAVNGMRPNGKVDQSSVQSDEVWSGVTYAVAATMLHEGMFREGFITARGMYKSCWEEMGMAFQTPEAIQKHNHFRSLAYMRPLSIWGMQYALENTKCKANPEFTYKGEFPDKDE